MQKCPSWVNNVQFIGDDSQTSTNTGFSDDSRGIKCHSLGPLDVQLGHGTFSHHTDVSHRLTLARVRLFTASNS